MALKYAILLTKDIPAFECECSPAQIPEGNQKQAQVKILVKNNNFIRNKKR